MVLFHVLYLLAFLSCLVMNSPVAPHLSSATNFSCCSSRFLSTLRRDQGYLNLGGAAFPTYQAGAPSPAADAATHDPSYATAPSHATALLPPIATEPPAKPSAHSYLCQNLLQPEPKSSLKNVFLKNKQTSKKRKIFWWVLLGLSDQTLTRISGPLS